VKIFLKLFSDSVNVIMNL